MAAKKKSPAKKKPAFKKKPSAGTKSKSSKKPAAGAKRKPATSGRKTSASKSGAGKKGAVRPVRKSKRPAPKRKVVAPKSKVNKGPRVVLAEAPEALALARSIAAVALEKKAENVLIVDTRSRSEAVGYDYVVLASGESDRQLSAIHEGVDLLLKPQGKRAASVEASPDWVCVNYDEGVVAHFFTPDKRDMMDLEDMWKDAPRVSL
jgi:ribosome-associated protein